MKPSCFLPPVCAALILSTSAALFAQTTATTDPVGFITLNVAGTGGTSASQISFAALGLTRPVEYQGALETVSNGTEPNGNSSLVDNDSTWTDNQFNGANGSYYVEITGPAGAQGIGTTYDVLSTTASTHKLVVVGPLATGITSGATFKVRKHWTIGSVFGPNNEAGLTGGTSTAADQVLIYTGTGYKIYYYQTQGFGTGWREVTAPGADASGAVIYPDDGVLIQRKQSSSTSIVLMGAVKTGQTSFPVTTGTNLIANVYASPMTLGDSGLYTGDPATGVAGGTSTSADQVLLWNGTGYDIYFYQTQGFGTGWRNVTSPGVDASTAQIPVGASIIIKRNGAPFNWIIPQHPATL